MTITTEEAERLAKVYGGFWGLRDVAAALRSLAAERDEALEASPVPIWWRGQPSDLREWPENVVAIRGRR